jgi:predicted N-acetyltransferase YhbS
MYCGLGHGVPYDEYIALINEVFGFTGTERDFEKLLPKLYTPARAPQASNYVVTEDGRAVAAVGAYDNEITVCGKTLKCCGIGNVAVHADCRSKGYMKATMNAALEGMIKNGVDFSALGGRRQRYQYFSYDRCGPCANFALTPDNFRHCCKGDAPFTARVITDSADPMLDDIKALSDNAIVAPTRSREDFLDIARSWLASLWVVTDGDRFVGYAIFEPSRLISEVRVVNADEIVPLLHTLFEATERQTMSLRLPTYETEYVSRVWHMAEGFHEGCSMMYSVLRYRTVVDAFLCLKNTYDPLPDGELRWLIHGFAGDERLCISVQDGVPSVSELPADAPVERELSHLDAMSVLFAPFSPLRDTLSDTARRWFPLPLWIYRADEV